MQCAENFMCEICNSESSNDDVALEWKHTIHYTPLITNTPPPFPPFRNKEHEPEMQEYWHIFEGNKEKEGKSYNNWD
jgi:hypothetical protein